MTYIEKRNHALASPAASHWLKDALRALDSRDPFDALNDVDALLVIAELRLREIFPRDAETVPFNLNLYRAEKMGL